MPDEESVVEAENDGIISRDMLEDLEAVMFKKVRVATSRYVLWYTQVRASWLLPRQQIAASKLCHPRRDGRLSCLSDDCCS